MVQFTTSEPYPLPQPLNDGHIPHSSSYSTQPSTSKDTMSQHISHKVTHLSQSSLWFQRSPRCLALLGKGLHSQNSLRFLVNIAIPIFMIAANILLSTIFVTLWALCVSKPYTCKQGAAITDFTMAAWSVSITYAGVFHVVCSLWLFVQRYIPDMNVTHEEELDALKFTDYQVLTIRCLAHRRVLGPISSSTPAQIRHIVCLVKQLRARPYHFSYKIRFYASDSVGQKPGFFPRFQARCSFPQHPPFNIIVGEVLTSYDEYVVLEVARCEDVERPKEDFTAYIVGRLHVPKCLVVPGWQGTQSQSRRRGLSRSEVTGGETATLQTREDIVVHFPAGHRFAVTHIWDHIRRKDTMWSPLGW